MNNEVKVSVTITLQGGVMLTHEEAKAREKQAREDGYFWRVLAVVYGECGLSSPFQHLCGCNHDWRSEEF